MPAILSDAFTIVVRPQTSVRGQHPFSDDLDRAILSTLDDESTAVYIPGCTPKQRQRLVTRYTRKGYQFRSRALEFEGGFTVWLEKKAGARLAVIAGKDEEV